MFASIALLYFHVNDIQLPFVDLRIPKQLVYFSIPIIVLYLWLQFGFVLFSTIDERSTLFHIGQLIESSLGAQGGIHALHQSRYALEDGGLLDLFTYAYLEQYRAKDELSNAVVFFCLFGIYGVLFGVVHASVFTVLFEANRRGIGIFGLGNGGSLIFLFVFLVSHLAFAIRIPDAMAWQGWFWFVAACGNGFYSWHQGRRR